MTSPVGHVSRCSTPAGATGLAGPRRTSLGDDGRVFRHSVGRPLSGEPHLAAMTLFGYLIWACYGMFAMISIGATALTARFVWRAIGRWQTVSPVRPCWWASPSRCRPPPSPTHWASDSCGPSTSKARRPIWRSRFSVAAASDHPRDHGRGGPHRLPPRRGRYRHRPGGDGPGERHEHRASVGVLAWPGAPAPSRLGRFSHRHFGRLRPGRPCSAGSPTRRSPRTEARAAMARARPSAGSAAGPRRPSRRHRYDVGHRMPTRLSVVGQPIRNARGRRAWRGHPARIARLFAGQRLRSGRRHSGRSVFSAPAIVGGQSTASSPRRPAAAA